MFESEYAPPLRCTAASAVGATLLLVLGMPAAAQQFAGDNQWVAPYGVGTFAATVGEEYAQLFAIAALLPEWEFNAQFTLYYDDPRAGSDPYTAVNLYAKRRLYENERGTGGYAVIFGTGLYPEHLEQGTVASAFQSWWLSVLAAYPFLGDQVLLDLGPGIAVNFDDEQEDRTAWGFTYASRVAVYGVVPHSALVAEIFGTVGEIYAAPGYRAGIRYESRRWLVAGTYSAPFGGTRGAGFELGALIFTNPIFCFGGCAK